MVNVFTPLNQLEPVQAANFEGVGYLEEVISGYRTLKVEGREPLNLELENIEIITRDGARYKRRRIESRQLTIHFALTAGSSAEFESKFNSLKSCLYKVEETKIIFDDEPDKYYVGTYKGTKIDYLGRSSYRGEITIDCADPFKYSVTETEVTSQIIDGQKVLVCNYGGTYEAYPVLTAQSEDSDNGFYGFAHSNGALIQIGDPSETDKVEETDPANAETVFNFWFNQENLANWTANNANLLRWSNNYIQTGSVTAASHYIYPTKPAGTYNYYFGPALKHTFTQEEGTHQNFEFIFKNWFQPAAGEGGGFDIYVNTAEGENICGCSVWHDKNSDIRWDLFANGKNIRHGTHPISNNPFAGWTTNRVQKIKDKLDFSFGGNKFSIDVPEIENLEAGEISLIFYFQPGAGATEANNALGQVAFRGIPNTWADVYNKIPEGALVEVDTGSGMITMDGYDAADLGAIGNEFEDFVLKPGVNTILCAASDWVNDAEYTMKYREVFL